MSKIIAWMEFFLFRPLDGRAVACFRIALALVLPWFFWSQGLKPFPWVPEYFHWAYDYIFISKGHYFLVTCLCVCFGLGWYPRLCGFLLFFLLFPLAFVAGVVSRPVMLFALLAFSFIPSNAAKWPWSQKNSRGLLDAGPCWPIRLIQLELTCLYGINALAKTSPTYLRGETLMDMSVSYSNFNVDLSSGSLVLGIFVMPVFVAAILSTLFEYLLALGFWSSRLKWFVACLGIGFHFTLTYIVSIFMLHYASIFLYLAFLLPLIYRNHPSKSGEVYNVQKNRETES